MGQILIFNRKPEERAFLFEASRSEGLVYTALDREKVLHLLETVPFSIALVDASLAGQEGLAEALEKVPCVILTGRDEERLLEIVRSWPAGRFVDHILVSTRPVDQIRGQRVLARAEEFARLKADLDSASRSRDSAERKLKDVTGEIRTLGQALTGGVTRELERRTRLEARYEGLQRLTRRLEDILRELYAANDVSNLLEVVGDIKDVLGASGISIYILEENETLGRFLKPLVWDDAFLLHADFARFVAGIPSPDFAASAVETGETIMLADPTGDPRFSPRYREALRAPLRGLLCMPLRHDQGTIGVIEVYNKTAGGRPVPEGFDADDRNTLKSLSEHIALAMTKLNLIQYDALTGLLRPDPFFDKVIRKVESQSKRRQEAGSFAMVMGDVDWFKAYNDRNGHEAGNRLLRDLAGVLKASVREGDLLCRYGGEEFLIFLSGVKNIEEAIILTERIRNNVEEHVFPDEERQPRNDLTMSFGVTLLPRDAVTAAGGISRAVLNGIANEADLALGEAKGKKLASLRLSDKLITKNKVCAFVRERAMIMSKTSVLRAGREPDRAENRRHERFFVSTVCLYRENGGHRVAGMVDLSLGGVKLSSEKPFSPGHNLDMLLILGPKASAFRGEVVWSRKATPGSALFYTGVRFRDMTMDDRGALEAYFNRLAGEGA